jgi:hypothetical protein
MTEETKNLLVNGLIIFALSLVIFAGGTWWRMASQYSLAEKARAKGDFTGALAGYESAIHMYIPFHPTIEKSAERLWEMTESNEKQGDIQRALIACRALRSSFYSAVWLTTPGQKWIERCDKKIAALLPLQRER